MSLFFSCNFQRFDPIVSMQLESNLMELISITLTKEHNPGLSTNIPSDIDGNDITFYIPPELDSTAESFILDFNIEGYSFVKLGNEKIESGKTPYVFGHDSYNDFTIYSANGDSREYRIRLVEEFHAFMLLHPDDPEVTEIPQYNSSFPVYIQFNSPVEAGSFTIDDLEIDASLQLSSDPVDMDGTGTLFKVEVGSTSAPSGEYSLRLPAGQVANQSTGANPPLNDNDSVLEFIWDIDPPFTQAGDSLSKNTLYAEEVILNGHAYEDTYSTSDEILYRIYYNSAPETDSKPTILDYSNYNTEGTPATDWLTFTEASQEIDLASLNSDHNYNFILAVKDKLGNITFSDNVEAFLTSTIHVSSTQGDDSTADGTKIHPFATIQPALDFAWEHGQMEVKVSQGTYYPGTDRWNSFHLYPDIQLQGGYNQSDFMDRDISLYETIISGDIDNDNTLNDDDDSEHLFFHPTGIIDPPDLDSTIDGFTFSYGRSLSSTEGGGAIFSAYSLTLKNCNFLKNSSSGIGGGAIHIINGAELNITDSTFYSNFSVSNIPGTIYYGGAIYAQNSTLNISDCKFGKMSFPNESNRGGAISVEDDPSKPTRGKLVSINNDFSMNSAVYAPDSTEAVGGAIYVRGSNGEFSSTSDTFSGNYTSNKGGAIYIQSNKMSIDNAYFSSNYCFNSNGTGGAISVFNGSLDLKNSNFITNWTSGIGGAIHLDTIRSSADIKSSVFKENGGSMGSANLSGGAIALTGDSSLVLTIENSVFIKNKSQSGPVLFMKGNNTFNVEARIFQSVLQENENSGVFRGGSIYIEKGNLEAGLNLFINNLDRSPTNKVFDIFMDSGDTMLLYGNEFLTDRDMSSSYFLFTNSLLGRITGNINYGYNHYSSSQNSPSSWKYLVNENQIGFETSNINTPLSSFFSVNFTNLSTTTPDKYFTQDSPFYPKYTPLDAPVLGLLIDKIPSSISYYVPSEDITGAPRLKGGDYDRGPYEHQH